MKRRGVSRLLLLLAVAVATGAGGWNWYAHRDYGAVYRRAKGRLVTVQPQKVARTDRTTTYDLRLESDTGLQTEARIRVPNADGKFPAVVLTVGLGTGKRVVELLDETDDFVLLAVDYSWREQFDVTSLGKIVRTLGRLRTLSDASVPRLLLAVDYLAREPLVDPARISVVGVSYGTYYALPVAAVDTRVRQVILVQGGGAIAPTLTANARGWHAPGPPRLWGAVGAAVFLPFEPERWVGAITPRRVTFIASRTDPMLPAAAVTATYERAGEPRALLWHDTPHVAPHAEDIIRELSRVVLPQLRQEGAS